MGTNMSNQNSAATSDASSDAEGPLAILTNCGVVLAVKVTMSLTVADPQAFVNNPNSARAVAEGIADSIGVQPDDVEVVLSVASSRRLDSHANSSNGNTSNGSTPSTSSTSSASGTVIVDATIQVADAEDVQTVQNLVDTVDEETFQTSLNAAIVRAGIAGVTVEIAPGSVTSEPAAPAGTTDSPNTPAPSAVPSTDSANMVTASKFVAVVALQQLF